MTICWDPRGCPKPPTMSVPSPVVLPLPSFSQISGSQIWVCIRKARGHVKTDCQPSSQSSGSVHSGWGSRFCISIKSPRMLTLLGSKTKLRTRSWHNRNIRKCYHCFLQTLHSGINTSFLGAHSFPWALSCHKILDYNPQYHRTERITEAELRGFCPYPKPHHSSGNQTLVLGEIHLHQGWRREEPSCGEGYTNSPRKRGTLVLWCRCFLPTPPPNNRRVRKEVTVQSPHKFGSH